MLTILVYILIECQIVIVFGGLVEDLSAKVEAKQIAYDLLSHNSFMSAGGLNKAVEELRVRSDNGIIVGAVELKGYEVSKERIVDI